MDGTELDEIMNEALAPEVIATPAVATPEPAAQPRDETGKFAPKANEAEAVEPDDAAARQAVEGGEHERGKVPVAAVQAEREKARLAREEAETLRREMAELRGQVSVLTQQRQPATPVEKPKPKNFWENPDEFLSERLAPVQQTMQQQRFEMSRMLADEKFGADVVKAADDALGELIQANDPSVATLQATIANSRHPYADLVAWHEKRKAMAEIGEDPAAFRARVEAEARAAIMAEYGIEATPAAAVPGTPSTTTKPLTKLPQSLSKLPGAGNSAHQKSADDVFNEVMAGR